MVAAAAAETPEPESGMGTGSGLGWQRADVARMLVADQPDLRCTSPCAVSGRNLYKTAITSQMPPPREREIRNIVCSGGTEP